MNCATSSDALVFFGATGDLAYKKIFPALQAMVKRGHLNVPVIGVAKAGWSLDQLRTRARDSLETHGGGVDGPAFDTLSSHLLQVTACLAMNAPSSDHPESLRHEKARLLEAIVPLDPKSVVRGQFRGYRNEPGVATDSRVETFAAARLQIESSRWEGVPFYIRAGKCLPVTCTEVLVVFKAPPGSAFGERIEQPNYVRFRLGPDVAVALGVRSKTPGEAMVGHEVELLATEGIRDEMHAYERLLGDAMNGDGTLFAREDAVEAEWRIVAPILSSTTPPYEYQTGTWGPAEADRLMDRSGPWHKPQPAPPRRPS